MFEQAVGLGAQPKAAANWLNGDVARILGEQSKELCDTALTAKGLCDMVTAIDKKTISNTAGKTVVEELMLNGGEVADIISKKGLSQISDTSALVAVVEEVLQKNEKAVGEYKNGKTNVLGFLVGQCMKATRGKGNPELLRNMLLERL